MMETSIRFLVQRSIMMFYRARKCGRIGLLMNGHNQSETSCESSSRTDKTAEQSFLSLTHVAEENKQNTMMSATSAPQAAITHWSSGSSKTQ